MSVSVNVSITAPLLSVRDLAVHLPVQGGMARPVDGVSFDIAAGECVALLGESGCGKSMTALAIMRLLPAGARIAGGTAEFEGRVLPTLPEAAMREVRGGGIGMIFQEPGTSLNPVLSIGRQIGEALELHLGLRGETARKRAVELLDQVGIPDSQRRLDEYPFQLSGGMKQRVMIAMALAGQPRLLIADEPTTALDVTIQAQVLDLLDGLRRDGMALLLITHDLGVVARMADRVGVMYAGQLVESAPRKTFFAAPAHPYSVRLFAAMPETAGRGGRLATIAGNVPAATTLHRGCRFVERCDRALAACHIGPPAWRNIEACSSTHRVRCMVAPREDAPSVNVKVDAQHTVVLSAPTPLLEVVDLKMHFPIRSGILQRVVGQVRAVDGVSLNLAAGRTLALVGESGCGKTTAGKAILQLLRPTAGSVRLAGDVVTGIRADVMQMVFQDPFASLNPRLRIGDIIAEGVRATAGQRAPQRVAQIMGQVGLTDDMVHRYPHEFSGGQRQRIAIARALAADPCLLICDEPTSALDVSVQAQILNLLSDLQRQLGLAYLFITHNIAVVDHLAHEVAVMYLGRIVEQGSTEAVLRDPRHPYTQALLAAVPRLDGTRPETVLAGDLPSPANPPAGCHFHPRCPLASAACAGAYPPPVHLGDGHTVACFAVTAHSPH